jgi:hypothetical protein
MTTGRTLLVHARQLVENGWTQHADARTADGQVVDPWNPAAVCWSLLGALVAALEAQTDDDDQFAIGQLAVACVSLAQVLDRDSLTTWNDDPSRTRESVLAALDDATSRTGGGPAEPSFN